MAIETLGVPVAYLLMSVLLLWLVIATRGRWWIKLGLISLALLYGIVLWSSLTGLQGWPTEAPMPDKFEIKWLETKEPDKKTGAPGFVYIWAVDLDPRASRKRPFFLKLLDRSEKREPRIYRTPYSRPLHEQVEEIRKTLIGGGRFYGTLKKNTLGAWEQDSGKRGAGRLGESKGSVLGKAGGGESEASLSYHQDYVFHELPPPRGPVKEPPAAPSPPKPSRLP